MLPFSVIIITKNESAHIAACLESAAKISTDIVVVDCGSTDDTVALAQQNSVRVIHVIWKNFGSSRNAGAAVAKHDWVMAFDADERFSPGLVRSLQSLEYPLPHTVYGFKRQSFFAGKKIRFGTWGKDKVFRLYHRQAHTWDESPVHEKLLPAASERKILPGNLIHFPVTYPGQFIQKIRWYAKLTADKYLLQQKRSTWIKRWLSPAFVFIQSYLLLLGFLDGKEGWIIARHLAYYTRLKYRRLAVLEQQNRG